MHAWTIFFVGLNHRWEKGKRRNNSPLKVKGTLTWPWLAWAMSDECKEDKAAFSGIMNQFIQLIAIASSAHPHRSLPFCVLIPRCTRKNNRSTNYPHFLFVVAPPTRTTTVFYRLECCCSSVNWFADLQEEYGWSAVANNSRTIE